MATTHTPAEGNDDGGNERTTHEEFARHWSPARDAEEVPADA